MSKVKTSADEIMAEKEMALRDFFPLETLTFKVAKLKDGSKAKTLTYLDCSAVRARLDDVLGANNWKNDIQMTVAGIVCKLSIRYTPDGEWIERSNAAGAEGDFTTGFGYLVAQCFDRAFCRTASLFGIGAYLYTLPDQWVPLHDGKFIKGKEPKIPTAYLPKNDKSKARGSFDETVTTEADVAVTGDGAAAVAVETGSESGATGTEKGSEAGAATAEKTTEGNQSVRIPKEELAVIAKYVANAKETGTRDGVRTQQQKMEMHVGLSDAAKTIARDELRNIFKAAPKGT